MKGVQDCSLGVTTQDEQKAQQPHHEVATLFVQGVRGRYKLLEIGQGFEGQPGKQGTANGQAIFVDCISFFQLLPGNLV
ncbi:hypothetical protein MTJW_20720 [Moorella thermoacetica]|nr:hypothetical protein MTJW_20720 [Moorella thermoacetica]